jgi:hypothetical protein
VTRVTRRRVQAGWTFEGCRLALLLSIAVTFPSLTYAWAASRQKAEDPLALIERCAGNEMEALQSPAYFRYSERLEWPWGSETRRVVETAEGRADRIVAFNDQPVGIDQSAKEERRLKKLLRDPKAVHRERDEQASETRRRLHMMQAFPRAFVFEPAGEEEGLLKFSFRPNHSFSPQDRETQVYRGMEGTVWVEPNRERLVRIDGTLTRDVSFGWGIFGRLHKGGHYFIEQTQVSAGTWRVTRLVLDLKIRTFFDTSRLLRKERDTRFRVTREGMTYTEAVESLLETAAGPDRLRD